MARDAVLRDALVDRVMALRVQLSTSPTVDSCDDHVATADHNEFTRRYAE